LTKPLAVNTADATAQRVIVLPPQRQSSGPMQSNFVDVPNAGTAMPYCCCYVS